MHANDTPERAARDRPRNAGTVRRPLAPWAAALLPVAGFLLLVDLAIWTDSLRSLMPALARDGAPLGFFVVGASGLIGLALLLGLLAYGETYVATLLTTVPIVPTVLGVAVLVVYLATDPGTVLHDHALYLGSTVALAAWAFAAPLLSWLAVVDTAQARSYGELVFRTRNLRQRVRGLDHPASQPGRDSTVDQVLDYVRDLERELGISGDPPAGLRYALGTGYVNLWREVHRAEELLIELEPDAEAIAGAVYDGLRLRRSAIPNSDELAKRLDTALRRFGPEAAAALDGVAPGSLVQGTPAELAVARALLREVRESINAYRDDKWEGLVRERNRLLRTILLTSAATVVFLLLGVIYHVARGPFAAAIAFYLIGATVGLFARLRSEGTAEAAVDDYGLFEARLLHTPLLSGLSGVAGVFVMAVAPSILGTNAAAGQAATVQLSQVFDLANNTRGLIAAGIFGLAPELLLRWLGSQADRIKGQLDASRAAGAAKPSHCDDDSGGSGQGGSSGGHASGSGAAGTS